MTRSPWIPLAAATDRARCGGKAATLARLLGEGLPVVPGWVLPVGAPADVDALLAEPVRRWILRSSSPLEDRPGRSAAGWFLSLAAGSSAGELSRALERVLASAKDPRVVQLLGAPPGLAVLAQPALELETWCTAELRAGERFYEGWTRNGAEEFRGTSHRLFDPLLGPAAAIARVDPALLELGIADERPWVLQVRAAPVRAPVRVQAPVDHPAPMYPGLGPVVHPGDADLVFEPDLEHCPTPMSVLLATTFGRWIAADPGHSPSRIVDGRWHDPVRPADPPAPEHPEAGYRQWREALDRQVGPALETARQCHEALDGGLASWRAFLGAWLDLQRHYFAMPTGAARRFAREVMAQSGRRIGLDSTPGARRRRRWMQLRERLLAVLPAPSADAIARWVHAHPAHPVALEVAATARRDRAVAVLPYDGFSPGLDEDPWPLYRALAMQFRRPRADEPGTDDERLASAILALAESDNEALLEAYALWRSAIREVARELPVKDLHALDIESFEGWLETGGDAPDPAGGRALHAAWSAALTALGSGGIAGRPAAGGQARGPARIAHSLLELEPGGIAIVDTLGPADAIAVPHFEGIVCAAGDLLGHASVLCREFGIPCVVGAVGAREGLARAREVLVDGDRGVVLDLSGPGDRA